MPMRNISALYDYLLCNKGFVALAPHESSETPIPRQNTHQDPLQDPVTLMEHRQW